MSADNAMYIWKKDGRFYCFDLTGQDEIVKMPDIEFAVYVGETLEDAMMNAAGNSYLGYTEYGNYYMGEVTDEA